MFALAIFVLGLYDQGKLVVIQSIILAWSIDIDSQNKVF